MNVLSDAFFSADEGECLLHAYAMPGPSVAAVGADTSHPAAAAAPCNPQPLVSRKPVTALLLHGRTC